MANESVTNITEDEAALYDRQIRLWGVEAQERMRNASILVVNIRGLATEVVKNIVLSGVGRITLFDTGTVTEEDLGCGFLFRESDVGRKRVDAAQPNVESLNPLVKVETLSDADVISDAQLPALIASVNLVCLTDSTKPEILRFNGLCRTSNVMFYAAGTYGILGYIFNDLLRHSHLSTVKAKASDAVKEQNVQYPSCADALASVRTTFCAMNRRQIKEVNVLPFFSVLGIWEFQEEHGGKLPDSSDVSANVLRTKVNTLIHECKAPLLKDAALSADSAMSLSQTSTHEFSPTCAVVGGLLAQDVLKALSRREPPYANFLTFDGAIGSGNVVALAVRFE